MATYNGERYVAQQITSILDQIGPDDELIISDDASSDSTVDIIDALGDPRIRLYRNTTNVGIIRNFDQALRFCQGDTIFLSDQDDIWRHDRIKKTMDIFRKYPSVTLILADVDLIDLEGHFLHTKYLNLPSGMGNGLFRAFRNIIKNRYHGCAIAIRKTTLDYILPIPHDVPMHDMWIGILNDLYGKTYYIGEPLINYRRHERNVTTGRRAQFKQIFTWRIAIIKSVFLHVSMRASV